MAVLRRGIGAGRSGRSRRSGRITLASLLVNRTAGLLSQALADAYYLDAETAGVFNLTVPPSGVAASASAVALTQTNSLSVAAASVATSASTPALTQTYNLSVAAASVATSASTPAATAAWNLAASPASVAAVASAPALTQTNLLTAAGASVATAASAPALTQTNQLAAAPASVATTASTPAATGVFNLAASPASVATALSIPTIALDGPAPIDLVVASLDVATFLSGATIGQIIVPDVASGLYGGGKNDYDRDIQQDDARIAFLLQAAAAIVMSGVLDG